VDDGQDVRTKVVVGLGNPGRKYARTRHNVGFRVLEALARRWAMGPEREAHGGLFQEARIGPPGEVGGAARRVMLLRPLTYMNHSGRAVGALTSYYRIAAEDVLVVLDELALPPGRLRLRTCGSAGGHKGLADVLAALGEQTVPRVRLGIGPTPADRDAVTFVLRPFGEHELEAIEQAIAWAVDAAEEWVFRPPGDVMAKYNGLHFERKVDDDE